MKRAKKTLVSLAIASMALATIPFKCFASIPFSEQSPSTAVTIERLSGTDRVGTAVEVANAGWTNADTAILALSDDANLIDALAAAPLAGKTAPILLTDNNTLTSTTKDELVKLGVKNVYVIGAVSQSVVDQVNAMSGIKATMLKGSDRIGTAAAISSELTKPAGTFVVGYDALADALSIASYAAANNYSILVANPDGTLPISETAYKGATTYIIGGPTLVKDIPGATRLFGADRFATNQAVLKALTYKYDHVYVANGTDAHLVDSLVATSLAAEANSPIVLCDTNNAINIAASIVQENLTSDTIVIAIGGSAVVPDAVAMIITARTDSPEPLGLPSGIASTLPDATLGTPYTASIKAMGGMPPYRYVATGLPTGLTMGTDGTISGIPAQITLPPGFGGSTDIFNVSVTDSAKPIPETRNQSFNLTVYQAVTGLNISLNKLNQQYAIVGTPYNRFISWFQEEHLHIA